MTNKIKYIALFILTWGILFRVLYLQIGFITGNLVITIGVLVLSVYFLLKIFKG